MAKGKKRTELDKLQSALKNVDFSAITSEELEEAIKMMKKEQLVKKIEALQKEIDNL